MKLLYNARIRTLDKSNPIASAILIDHDRILAVHGRDELVQLGSGRLEEEDMRGKTIWPGLTDAHLHLQSYSLNQQYVDCETDSKTECLHRIAARAAQSKPGEWVLGHGWNQNLWGGWPDAADLDAVSPQNPVYLTAKSLHAAWVNTGALNQASINNGPSYSKASLIQRTSAGQATGILLESAMELVSSVIPAPGISHIEQSIEQALPGLWRLGLTAVHDFDRRDCFLALQNLRARESLKLRVHKSLPVDSLDHVVELGLRSGFGDDWLWIGSIKAFMDGALGPRTAAMFKPYSDDPENVGVLNLDSEELFDLGRRAARSGLSLSVHAIGDRANHAALDAFEHLRAFEKEHSLPRLRHRIEHLQLLHPDDAGRLAELDVIASMQPIHATSDMLMADRSWGDRSSMAYAWRTQLDSGARLAFGSDAPVESPNPFWGLHAAVTRQRADGSPSEYGWYPAQKLSLTDALEAFTLGPAYAAGAENRLGRLAPGYLADLIVLARDPFDCHPSEMLNQTPSATMIAGEWVWRA